MISRRGFLECTTMTAAGFATAGFPVAAFAADDATSPTDVVARLTLDDARFFVGSVFRVHTASGTFRFLCVGVNAVGMQNPTSSLQPFAMRFRPQSPISLEQGAYTFEHPVLGQFRLFIVPSMVAPGRGTTPHHYTAVINHSTS